MSYYNFIIQQKMWYNESYLEKGIICDEINEDYAIYPMRIYKNIFIPSNKIYDFIFIGSFKIDEPCYQNRKWILNFIQQHFNNNSYLQFTDKITKQTHSSLGEFDYTFINKGVVPKQLEKDKRDIFDKDYYEKMSKSKFALCPAGDSMWSMRFYECLMTKCIPIVDCKDETYRSKKESFLNYKYYLSSDKNFIYKEDWVNHNYQLFLKYHTLEYLN